MWSPTYIDSTNLKKLILILILQFYIAKQAIKAIEVVNQYNQSQGKHCLNQMLNVFRVSSGTSKDNIKAFLDMLQPF